MKKLVFALLVVVGLLGAAWAADSYARTQTEQRIAAEVGARMGATVEVSVEGFPVLTQLAAGSLDHVVMDFGDVTLEGVRLLGTHVVARGMTTTDPSTISSLIATTTVPIEEVNRLFREQSGLPADIRIQGDSLAVTGEFLGAELGIVFGLEAADGGIALQPEALTLGGVSLDVSRLGGLVAGLAGDIVLPVGLEEGLRIAAIDVVPQGLQLQVEGTDYTPDMSLLGGGAGEDSQG